MLIQSAYKKTNEMHSSSFLLSSNSCENNIYTSKFSTLLSYYEEKNRMIKLVSGMSLGSVEFVKNDKGKFMNVNFPIN